MLQKKRKSLEGFKQKTININVVTINILIEETAKTI
jgi:hypothetical protein